MPFVTFQLPLRPALIEIQGGKDFREERDLFLRLDEILLHSKLEQEFIELALHEKNIDSAQISSRQLERFCMSCRMPQEPLAFLSVMNSLVRKMTAARRVRDGKKKRKACPARNEGPRQTHHPSCP